MAGELIRAATQKDALHLAAAMRAADAAECVAIGCTPLEGVVESMKRSLFSHTVEFDGQPAAIWGVVQDVGHLDVGMVWVLTSNVVDRHHNRFWRTSVRVLRGLASVRPVLFNFIDARYEKALRWAARLGFEIQTAVGFGPQSLPFHPAIYRRP